MTTEEPVVLLAWDIAVELQDGESDAEEWLALSRARVVAEQLQANSEKCPAVAWWQIWWNDPEDNYAWKILTQWKGVHAQSEVTP